MHAKWLILPVLLLLAQPVVSLQVSEIINMGKQY